jgi:hypothetical protein
MSLYTGMQTFRIWKMLTKVAVTNLKIFLFEMSISVSSDDPPPLSRAASDRATVARLVRCGRAGRVTAIWRRANALNWSFYLSCIGTSVINDVLLCMGVKLDLSP